MPKPNFFGLAAGYYLSLNLPSDWEGMSETEQDNFITDHTWEVFEHCTAWDMRGFINELADEFENVYERGRKDA